MVPQILEIGSPGDPSYAQVTAYSVTAGTRHFNWATVASEWKTMVQFNGEWNRGTSRHYVHAAATNNASYQGLYMNHGTAGDDNIQGKLTGCMVMSTAGIPAEVTSLFDTVKRRSGRTMEHVDFDVSVGRAYSNIEEAHGMRDHNDGNHYVQGTPITAISPGEVAFSMTFWTTPAAANATGPRVRLNFPKAPGCAHVCIIQGPGSLKARHSVSIPKCPVQRTAFVFRTLRPTTESLIRPSQDGNNLQRLTRLCNEALSEVWAACQRDVTSKTLGAKSSSLSGLFDYPDPVWGQPKRLLASHWMSLLYSGNYFLCGNGEPGSEMSCHPPVMAYTNMHRESSLSQAIGTAHSVRHATTLLTSVCLDFTSFTQDTVGGGATLTSSAYANIMEIDAGMHATSLWVAAPSNVAKAMATTVIAQASANANVPIRVLVKHAPVLCPLPIMHADTLQHPKVLEYPNQTQAHYVGLGYVRQVSPTGFWLNVRATPWDNNDPGELHAKSI
jgi:hypothetical protein